MPRLKNRNNGLPNDYQIIHPEAGMTKPYRYPSFTGVVIFETRFRKGNPAICEKNGWTLDPDEIKHYVEQQQVQRMLARGHTEFLIMDANVPKSNGQRELPAALAAAAGHLAKLGATKEIYVAWIGDGMLPVPIEIAEKRAAVCVVCPQNQTGDLWQRLTRTGVQRLRALLNLRKSLQFKTSQDEKLKTCVACDCPMTLKVHTPIEHIIKNTSDEVLGKLDRNCWITEASRTPPV